MALWGLENEWKWKSLVLVSLVKPSKVDSVMKKKDDLPFINDKSLEEIKYLGVGFFEWIFILATFGVVLSSLIRNY